MRTQKTARRFALVVLTVVLLAGSFETAHPSSLESPQPWSVPPPVTRLGVDGFVVELVGRLGHDYSTQLQFPFRYAKQSPGRFLLGTAGIVSMVLTDHWTYDALAPRAGLAENSLVEPAQRLSKWGNGKSALPLVIGLGAVGLLADSPRERETSVMLFEALLTSATWTQVIKTLSGRERPREREESVSAWEGPSFLFDDEDHDAGLRAFPSGHSTGIWATATILAYQYPSRKIIPVLAFGTATAMSYSRMVLGAHWLSDVVVGGLIGWGSAKQVLSAHRSGYPQAKTGGVALGVDVLDGYQGFNLRYDF